MSRFAGIKALHAPSEALIGNGREAGPNAAAEQEEKGFCRAARLSRAEARSLCSILLPRPAPSTSICKTKKQTESRRALRLSSAHHTPQGARSLCRVALSAAASAAALAYYSSKRQRRKRRGRREKNYSFRKQLYRIKKYIHSVSDSVIFSICEQRAAHCYWFCKENKGKKS